MWREKTEEGVGLVMRTRKMEVDRHQKIARQQLRWSDVIRKDTKEKGVKIEGVQDRIPWRCADLK